MSNPKEEKEEPEDDDESQQSLVEPKPLDDEKPLGNSISKLSVIRPP